MIAAALLTVVTIGLWATALLPEYLTALLFFAAAMILGVAPAATVFSGFASAAFWLILSGFVLGIAIKKTGLADRAARLLARHLSGSYVRMVAGTVLLTYGLAFVMPSNMGRIALLMPIVLALADRSGVRGRGRAGLALIVGFGTFSLSASILPSNVPNLIMAGSIEAVHGWQLTYLPYLALHAPVLGILKGFVLAGLVLLLFPDRAETSDAPDAPPPMTPAERRLALLLAVTLALWMTDAAHGISPAWVGLAAACLCLLPRVGFVTAEEFGTQVNFRTAIYIAGILGLAAVVAASGLGAALGRFVLAVAPLDPARPFGSFMTLIGIAAALNFAVTANGLPALYTPLAGALAAGSGLPLDAVLMIQVIGYATPLLPYQASPVVVAMEMGRVRARDGTRLSLPLAAVTAVALAPLDYAWFGLLGWLSGPR